MNRTNPLLLVLTGTTASSKNRTGVELALALDGEILSLDSMKVYRGMDLGTDKPDATLRARVPHHLLDLVGPEEEMNLRRFVSEARRVHGDIVERRRTPIAVGGTAMYLKGFLEGVFEGPPADPAFRTSLREEAKVLGSNVLHARLSTVDPVAAARIHCNDYKRIERALEVARAGTPISSLQREWSGDGGATLDHRTYILTWPRPVLDRRIDERVDRLFAEGFVAEVAALESRAVFGLMASQALGYREVRDHLAGRCSEAEARQITKARTRQFARRQLTWFRRIERAVWIEGREGEGPEVLAARIAEDYRRRD